MESPATCGLSPDLDQYCFWVKDIVAALSWWVSCCGPVLVRDLLLLSIPSLFLLLLWMLPSVAEGTVALSWGCRDLQGGTVTCWGYCEGAVTCLEVAVTCKEVPWPAIRSRCLFLWVPLSILVGAAVYSASSEPQPCLLWGLGFLLLGFLSFLVSWLWWHERSIYRWLEILYRSEPSFNWA